MTRSQLLITAALSVAACSAQTIRGVSNGASGALAPIAQGSIFDVTGSGMGPSGSNAPIPYPSTWGGVKVTIQAAGQEWQAPIVYTSSSKVSAILPSSVPEGEADVTVAFSSSRSRPFRFRVAAANFGLYSQSGDGQGPAMAGANGKLIQFTNPAKSSQVITLLGTGLGKIDGPDHMPPGQRSFNINADVIVGAATVRPTFAGRSPQLPGVDMIQFQLPPDSGEGCYVPVAVRIDGVTTNFVTVSKSDSRASCEHPLGLKDDVLRKLDAGQRVNLGMFALQSATVDARFQGKSEAGRIDGGEGKFVDLDPTDLMNVTGAGLGGLTPPPGGCAINTQRMSADGAADALDGIKDAPRRGVRFLNAGTLSMSGPGGRFALNRDRDGAYSGVLSAVQNKNAPSTLSQGQWMLTGQGGSEVGAFAANVNVGQLLDWNQDLPDVIDASQPLTLFWNPGSSTDRDLFVLAGVFISVVDPNTADVTAFACSPKASAGSFTVPYEVMARIPASANLSAAVLAMVNTTVNDSINFTAPLGSSAPKAKAAGATIDAGVFTTRVLHLKLREYRK